MTTVSTEELAKLKEIRQRFEQHVYKYGELCLQKRIIESQIQTLEDLINDVETERVQLAKEVEQKYGITGMVDLNTGAILPV